MSRSLTSIVGLGIATSLFLALMSMFYLQQIPTAEDLRHIEEEIRRSYGLYLSAVDPLLLELVRPGREGEHTGVRVVCTMRNDIQKMPAAVDAYLDRIGQTVLEHPDLKGRVSFVTVQSSGGDPRERTIRPRSS